MAQLASDGFTTPPLNAQWTVDTANGGTVTVASDTVTLAITGTAGSRARIRTAPTTFADADTYEVEAVSATDFNCYVILRDNTGGAVFQPGLDIAGGNWRSVMFRDLTGGLSIATGPSAASRPRARLRRIGEQLACETWNGTQWVSFGTLDATTSGGLWTPSWDTARAELMCNDIAIAGPASFVIAQVGNGGGGGGGALLLNLLRRRRAA